MALKDPRYSSQISLGNILSILSAIIAAAGMIFIMEARSKANLDDIAEVKRYFASLENRVRGMEIEQARADERFSSILSLLSKIDIRLGRIEEKK